MFKPILKISLIFLFISTLPGIDPGLSNAQERGLGGTGISPTLLENKERGLGGTGITDTLLTELFAEERGLGGTGIIGTITAFGSIWVNGIEVEYDHNSRITIDGKVAVESQLRIGQQVEVIAHKQANEIIASSIAIRHQVIAPIESINKEQRSLTLLGQTVHYGNSQVIDNSHIGIGQTVRISGYRNDHEEIIATGIEPAPSSELWQLSGSATQSAEGLFISGFKLPLTSDIAAGDRVTIRGTWQKQTARIQQIIREPSLPFNGQVSTLYVESRLDSTPRRLRYAGGVLKLSEGDGVTSRAGFARITIEQGYPKMDRWVPESEQTLNRIDHQPEQSPPNHHDLRQSQPETDRRPERPEPRPQLHRGPAPQPGSGFRMLRP